MDHDDLERVRDGNEFVVQTSGVEEERPPRTGQARRHLVHDPDPRPDELVLGRLADAREVRVVQREGEGRAQSAKESDLKGGDRLGGFDLLVLFKALLAMAALGLSAGAAVVGSRRGDRVTELLPMIANRPDGSELLALLADLQRREGDLNAAMATLEKLQKIDPRNPAVNQTLPALRRNAGR